MPENKVSSVQKIYAEELEQINAKLKSPDVNELLQAHIKLINGIPIADTSKDTYDVIQERNKRIISIYDSLNLDLVRIYTNQIRDFEQANPEYKKDINEMKAFLASSARIMDSSYKLLPQRSLSEVALVAQKFEIFKRVVEEDKLLGKEHEERRRELFAIWDSIKDEKDAHLIEQAVKRLDKFELESFPLFQEARMRVIDADIKKANNTVDLNKYQTLIRQVAVAESKKEIENLENDAKRPSIRSEQKKMPNTEPEFNAFHRMTNLLEERIDGLSKSKTNSKITKTIDDLKQLLHDTRQEVAENRNDINKIREAKEHLVNKILDLADDLSPPNKKKGLLTKLKLKRDYNASFAELLRIQIKEIYPELSSNSTNKTSNIMLNRDLERYQKSLHNKYVKEMSHALNVSKMEENRKLQTTIENIINDRVTKNDLAVVSATDTLNKIMNKAGEDAWPSTYKSLMGVKPVSEDQNERPGIRGGFFK